MEYGNRIVVIVMAGFSKTSAQSNLKKSTHCFELLWLHYFTANSVDIQLSENT